MAVLTKAELGLRLQSVRGAIWQEALAGDAYAHLLRDYVDPSSTIEPLAFTTPVTRSAVGAWIVTDPALATTVLTDDAFGHLRTDGHKAHLQILPLPEAGLTPGPTERERIVAALATTPGFHESWTNALTEHAFRLARELEHHESFDLVGDYAGPLAVRALTEVARHAGQDADTLAGHVRGLACVSDALATPQTLDDVLAVTAAVRAAHLAVGRGTDDRATHPPLPLTVLYLATAPTAVVAALREHCTGGETRWWSHRNPPLRLLPRVAQHDLELGGHRIPENDQVVVLVEPQDRHLAPDDTNMVDTVVAADPWSAALRNLLDLTVTIAADVLLTRFPGLRSEAEPLRRPRSPVTRRFAQWQVSTR